jgi:hypothetical protein
MKVTDEMVNLFIDRYYYVEPIDHDSYYGFHEDSVKEAIQVAIDAMPKQEPVARYLGEGRIHVYGNKDIEKETILYTHTGIKLQPQQKPLSEDEIFELFSKQNFTAYKIDDGTDHNDLVAVDRAFIDFARSIEKAHGIGAEK